MRILIVDDDEMALMFVRHTLEHAGYEVDEAHDGQEALEIVRRGGHRVIVTDLDMPRMDGGALCRALRSDPQLAYTYVILLSANAATDADDAGHAPGPDRVLRKPLEPRLLIGCVEQGVRIAAGREPG